MMISGGNGLLTSLIKELLSLKSGSTYTIQTMYEKFEIRFDGDPLVVKEEVYKWLKWRMEKDETNRVGSKKELGETHDEGDSSQP